LNFEINIFIKDYPFFSQIFVLNFIPLEFGRFMYICSSDPPFWCPEIFGINGFHFPNLSKSVIILHTMLGEALNGFLYKFLSWVYYNFKSVRLNFLEKIDWDHFIFTHIFPSSIFTS